jgi:apolipoprotein N-acyltransferase
VLAAFGALRLANLSDGHSASSASMIRLVQPAIPQADKWDRSKRQLHLDRLVGLSQQGDKVPKLVIWPETAFAGFVSRSQSLLNTTIRNATQNDGVVITGITRFGGGRTLLNSAIMMNHEGAIKAVYDKRHLVPFGEYMPLRKWLPFLEPIVGPIDFVPGENNRLMRLKGYGSMQMLICYEVIFAGAVIGQEMRPDMMINITNDAWFGQSAGPWQHLVQAQMRAIEEGLPLMRVANTGITAGFDSYGRILGQIGLGTQGVLDLRVPLPLTPTLFARFGNLGFFALIFLIIGSAAWLDLFRTIRH